MTSWFRQIGFREFLDPVEEGGRGPIAVGSLDLGALMRLGIPVLNSFGDMLLPPDAGMSVEDIPDVEVWTKGLLPNRGAIFRTKNGFQIVQRQTLPGGTPLAALGLGAGGLFSARAVAPVERMAAPAVDSMDDLRNIGMAIHEFHATHEAFPASHSMDRDGKPLLSWRVHILPYLGEQALYEQFHLDEPWDSEHNMALIDQMPSQFLFPMLDLETGKTVYLASSGEGSLFVAPQQASDEAPKGIGMAAILDGTSNTIMVVEAPQEQAVFWTEPSDFHWQSHESISEILQGDGSENENFVVGEGDEIQRVPRETSSEFLVLMADASVRRILPGVDEEVLQSLFSINDGTVPDRSNIE